MHLRRLALWLICGFLAVLAAVLLFVWFGDPGIFKPQLERWVSEKTGREFAIDGRLDINIGRHTVIVAEGIRFENADWAESKDMLGVGSLELRIDTLSAFGAPLTIELIKLDGTELQLERPVSGHPNWVFSSTTDAAEPNPDKGPLAVIVRHIETNDVRVVYRSPERTGPLELRVATLRQQHRADDFLELTLDGELGDRKVGLRVVAGTWEALLAQENIDYEFEGQLDNFAISSKGTIDNLAAPRRPELTFAARGPDINELLRILQLKEGGTGDIDLVGSIRPGEDDLMALSVKGRLGQASVDATGTVADLQGLERFDVSARASAPDLSRILALFGLEGVREAPFTIDLDASRQGVMLEVERAHLEIAEASFDLIARLPGFPALDEGTASLTIAGSDFARLRELLRLPGAASGPFSLGLQLDSDAAGNETLRVDLTSTLASLEAEGRVSGERNFRGSEIKFAVNSESLARVGQAYGLERLPDLPITARGSITVEADAIRLQGPVTAEIRNTRLEIDGLIARAPRLEGSRLSWGINTPDLAHVVGMFAPAERVPPLPASLNGDVLLQGDSVSFDNVRGSFGRSSVSAEGTLSLAPHLAGSEFALTASGPAFEELVAHIPTFEVVPGNYELSGQLALGEDAIRLENIELSRARGEAAANLTIGLSQPAVAVDFDVSARGGSVRSILLPQMGDIELDDVPFSVMARGGLRGANLKLARFDVEVGQATLAASGEIDLQRGGRSTNFDFALHVPSLARLGLFEERRPRDKGLSISARLRGDAETVNVENLVARIGDSDVHGSAKLEKGSVPNLYLDLQSDVFRVAPLLEEPSTAYEAAPEFEDGRLIPDVKLPFEAMRKLNATVTIDVGELQREALVLNAVELRAEMRDGAFYLRDIGFQNGEGWLRARASLEPAGGAGKATLALKARGLSLGLIDDDSVGPPPSTDMDINLEANGTDLRALAGSSNGVLYLDGHDFTIANNLYLKRLYGDLLNEILETINPFAKSNNVTQVGCIVLPIEIADGKLQFAPDALMRTDKIRIVSHAAIDLKSEKIEMTFRTTPRKGLTISAGEIFNPFVMVVGTLAKPGLAVDAKGTLISGGAAVATGGLSILAKATWDRLTRSKDPCPIAAQQGLEVVQDRFAEFPARSGTQTQ